ncbi:MAG: ABC transporter permease [Mucilaginibacter polytrichastri]|nr:ABC transporter permease [Mucilaginibacter polytrichastri]
MFKNYLKIAWRNLWRNKLYSFINIGGLALGLTICMLIMLYVAHEHSYDSFHKNASRIFSVHVQFTMGGNKMNMPKFNYPVGPMTQKADAHVADYMRLYNQYTPVVIRNPADENLRFSEKSILFTDANFFSFFSFPLLKGDVKSVLKNPFSVVISQEKAHKYFGDENPVGKTLSLRSDSTYLLQVTGVMANSPSNTDLKADFIIALSSMKNIPQSKPLFQSQIFQGGAFKTYFLLKNAADTAQVKRTMRALGRVGHKEPISDEYFLTNIADSHLEMNFDDVSGNSKYLKIFPIVAGLILLLALVNYMSLSTARATLRAKEIGVRKVTGAGRKTIATQFYVESAIYALLSFALAYIVCNLFQPLFFNLLQLRIDASFLYHPMVLAMMAGLLLLTIAAAGLYPSIVLSSFKPVEILSGKMSNKGGGAAVRKVFTTVQFVISVALMICGLVIDRQLHYMRNTETGVQRENVLMVPVQSSMRNHYQSLRNDLQNLPGVQQVATAHYPMYKGYDTYFIESKKKKGEQIDLPNFVVDKNFIPTLGIQWKYKPLEIAQLDKGKKIVINEAAVRKLDVQGAPVGQFVDFGRNENYEIAGVVKDFNFQSLDAKIDAIALFINPDTTNRWGMRGNDGACIFLKTSKGTNLPSLISKVKNTYEKYDKTAPFEYQFMDDAFNAMFQAEDRLAGIFSLFIGLTVFIAGLGLFGLATFSAQQRIKEIGIRKVLGASVVQITSLLSRDFLRLVLIAVVIASPIAFFTMQNWLQDFAYRIHLQWWMFALTGFLAVGIAFFTVSFQAIRSALANPVKSLRTE